MSTLVNTGWLKDNNGEKFAPKTLSSQVVTSNGTILESKINLVETTLNSVVENQIYVGNNAETATTPLNADTLGGRPADEYALKSEIENLVNIPSFVVLSQAEYDALTTKDPNTIYYIYEEV